MQSIRLLFPHQEGVTAAVLAQPARAPRSKLALIAHVGERQLWMDYLALCRTGREPMLRKLRLGLYPVTLSDIVGHPGLQRRAMRMRQVFAQHDMHEAFAVPLFDQELSFSTLIFAGRDLPLHPAYRHLLSLAAGDTLARMTSLKALASSTGRKPHHALTPRQMEIATWLVAGKTDWEIGEILKISPKTVNFHVENIKRTYGVKSRNQFVAAIVHDGGLHPS